MKFLPGLAEQALTKYFGFKLKYKYYLSSNQKELKLVHGPVTKSGTYTEKIDLQGFTHKKETNRYIRGRSIDIK